MSLNGTREVLLHVLDRFGMIEVSQDFECGFDSNYSDIEKCLVVSLLSIRMKIISELY
jgi:hypothetical protein